MHFKLLLVMMETYNLEIIVKCEYLSINNPTIYLNLGKFTNFVKWGFLCRKESHNKPRDIHTMVIVGVG